MKLALFLIIICLTSCTFLIQETIGRKVVSEKYPKIMNSGTIFTFTIPFTFVNGSPCISVKINDLDSSYHFIFDTGSFTYVSENIIEEKTNLNRQTYDSNGKGSNTYDVELNKIYFNNFCFNNIKIKSLKDFKLENIDGVLGVDFMIGKVFYFDLKNQLLTISNKNIPIKTKTDNIYESKLYKSWDNRFYIKVDIFNRNEKLFFDTGCNTFIYLNDENLVDFKEGKSYLKQSQGAFSSSYVIRNYYDIDSMELFEIQFHDLTIQSNEKNVFGAGVFSKMDIKIDFIKNRLFFYNNKELIFFEKETPNSEIVLGWDNFLYIKEIEVNAFSRTNLLPGDKIISIDNNKVPDKLNDLILYIKNEASKSKYVFEIQRGDSVFTCEIDRKLLIQK